MKIVITGGAGFIGTHLTKHWLSTGADVTVIDNFRSGLRENLEPLMNQITLVEADIRDKEKMLEVTAGATYVFHLAALVSVPESVSNIRETIEINNFGLLNMLDAARGAGAKKFVLSSSAAVYGDEPVIPSRETDIPAPLSPYAITKLDGEYYCGMYQSEFGLPTAVLRYFNVFGEGQRPDSQYAAAIPAFVSRAIKGSPMTIFGDGGQTRDFVYVGDVVAANVLAAECGSGVYNVARGEKTTILELAQIINQICGGRSTISHEAARAGDVRHSTALTKRIQELGFVPKMELQTGLERTVADLKIRLT